MGQLYTVCPLIVALWTVPEHAVPLIVNTVPSVTLVSTKTEIGTLAVAPEASAVARVHVTT